MRKSLWLGSLFLLCLWGSPLGATGAVDVGTAPDFAYGTYASFSTSFVVDESVVIEDIAFPMNLDCPYAIYVAGLMVTSPSGTSCDLTYYMGGYGDDIDAVFSDSGATVAQFNYSGTPGAPSLLDLNGGMVKPAPSSGYLIGDTKDLSTGFDGETTDGEWTLQVYAFYSGVVKYWGIKAYTADPVSSLSCLAGAGAGDVDLSWTNGGTDLDAIQVWVGGDILLDLGAGEVDLGAGASNLISAGTFPVPSSVDFTVVCVVGSDSSQGATCGINIINEPTASASDAPSVGIGGGATDYYGFFNFPAPGVVIGDMIVDMHVTYPYPYYLQIYIASWSGTTVGLFDTNGGSLPGGSSSLGDMNVGFWSSGSTLGSGPLTGGALVKPTGPGALSDFFGEETVDSLTGEDTWLINVGSFYTFYSGTLYSLGIRVFEETISIGSAAAAPTSVACTPGLDLGTMTATWTNASDYDNVVIYVDNAPFTTLAGPFGTGSFGSYDFAVSTLPYELSVQVQGEVGGNFSKRSSCSAILKLESPTDLLCSAAGGGTVDLSWTSPTSDYYDSLTISVDGDDVDTIDGSETFWNSGDVGMSFDVPSTHLFAIRGSFGVAESGNASCNLLLLDPLEVNACASPEETISAGELTSDVTVSDAGTVEYAEVMLSASHGYLYYFSAYIDAPSGTSIDLQNPYMTSYFVGHEILMVFVDGGEDLTSLSTDEYDDGLQINPTEPLANLAGEGLEGTWTFRSDVAYGGMTLHNWCLRMDFCGVLPPYDLTATAVGEDIEMNWFLGDTYDVQKIMLDGAEFDEIDGGDEFYTVEGVEVGRHNVRVVGVNFSEGCDAPSPVAKASVGFTEVCISEPATYFYPSVDLEIAWPDPIVVGSVELGFDLTTGYGYAYYYALTLTSPYGTSVNLFSHEYLGTGLMEFDCIFSPDGESTFSTVDCDGCLIEPSDGDMTDFAGELADGDWVLNLSTYGDTGTLNSACLAVFEGCTVIPVADVTCEAVPSTKNILLTWLNGDSYDAIKILRNDNVIAEIGGSEEEYTDEGLPSNFYTYQILAVSTAAACESGSRPCKGSIGITEICNEEEIEGSASDVIVSEIEVTDDIAIDEIRFYIDATTPYNYIYTVAAESPSGTNITFFNYYDGYQLPTGGTYNDWECTWAEEGEVLPVADFSCGSCVLQSQNSLEPFFGESPLGTWEITFTSISPYYTLTHNKSCLQLMIGCPIGRPENVTATTKDGLPPITVAWELGDTYDGQKVIRDGVVIATVGAEDTEFVDDGVDLGGGFHEYAILAESVSLDCSKLSKTGSVGIGLLSNCSAPYSILNEVTQIDFLNWESSAMDDAEDCDPPLDLTIAEAQVSVDVDTASYAYYIDLQLHSPDNTVVVLKDGFETITSGFDINVIFSDDGSPLGSGNQNCECPVAPTGPGNMSDFNGEDPRGDWMMLSASEYGYYGGGYLNSYCVEVFLVDLPICGGVPEQWFKRGDCNNNGTFQGLQDAQYLLNYAFNQGPTPACMTACDANGNNSFQGLQDAQFILNYAFNAGPIPPSPGPSSCGVDPQNPQGDAGGCATESTTCNNAH